MLIEPIINQIVALLQKIQDKIDWIAAKINRVLSYVPGFLSWVVDKVKAGWDLMVQKLAEFWMWFVDKLSYAGNPWMLTGAAEAWVARVGSPVSKINDTLSDASFSVDDEWVGRAANQYKQGLEPQRRANTSVLSDFAQNFGSALNAMSGAIWAFWIGVIIAIVTLIGGLAGAAAATGTIVGIPAAPVIICAAVIVCLVSLGGGVGVLYLTAGAARTTLASASAGISAWPKLAL